MNCLTDPGRALQVLHGRLGQAPERECSVLALYESPVWREAVWG